MGIEIERKFLVKTIPEKKGSGVAISQGYILRDPETVIRVRIYGDKGFLTLKGKAQGLVRPEYEYEIPEPDARNMLVTFCKGPLIEKTRYTLFYRGDEWVIDEFLGRNQGLVVAEIELSDENQTFDRPSWVGEEVTQDIRYLNSNLAVHPFSQWP